MIRASSSRRPSPGLLPVLTGILTAVAGFIGNASAAVPSRATLEKHRDLSIQVFGSYAAVKLPITHGVTPWNPTAIGRAPDGTLFAANYTGEIYRLVDSDGDGLEDTAQPYADVRHEGLRYPTSLAFRGREVFVGTAQQVRVYEDTDGDGIADRSLAFFEGIPFSGHTFDWTFGLCWGPDGWLHLALSTDSYNPQPAGDPNGWRGSILRISPDGKTVERFATGLRFPYGMAFNERGHLFFTDNRGGENPTEEINFAQAGHFYGQHPGKFPEHPPTTPPLVQVQFGYGMAGMTFNSSTNGFGGTGGDLFAACWGPDFLWKRGSIIRVHLTPQPGGGYRAREYPFAREVPKISAVTFGTNGDLYVAQFGRETIGHTPLNHPDGGFYRFIAVPGLPPANPQIRYPVIAGNRTHGAALFRDRGCAGCHVIGDEREMLGPDLGGLGDMMTEEEVLAAIQWPSQGIKSGYETEQITTKDGETVLGRVLSADLSRITLVTAGNLQVSLQQTNVASHQSLTNSMMPEGLLDGMTTQDRRDLLAFLGIRDREPHGMDAVLLQCDHAARWVFLRLVAHPLLTSGALGVVTLGSLVLLVRGRRRASAGSRPG
jgi:putative heme-binding domain-containing protein